MLAEGQCGREWWSSQWVASMWCTAVPAPGTEGGSELGGYHGTALSCVPGLYHHYDGRIPEVESCALGNYGARCDVDEKVRGWRKCCVSSGHRGTGRTQANSSLLAPENAPVTHQAQCTFSSWPDSW